MSSKQQTLPANTGQAQASSTANNHTVQQQLENSLETIGVTNSHRKVLALILLGVLFDVLEQNAVGLVGPLLQEHWGLTPRDVGFLNTLTYAAAALGRLLSGYIADHYGRRVMLTINLALFTLGALICALAPSYWVLGLGRMIVGFGLGGEISIAVTMLAEFCSSRFRGTAVGTINVAGGGLGNMLAPAFGLLVFTLFPGPESWRWVFGLLVMPAFMVLFYHDTYWQEVDRPAMNQRIFRALKPGGIYGIIDHHAAAGAGADVVKTLHRIEREMVVAELLEAGFMLDAESDLLAHADDARSLNVFDPAVRGKTDQFVLRFRKPNP